MVDFHTKRILVTGSSGFIGTNLIQEFVRKGYSVICLLEPGTSLRVPLEGQVECREADIRDRAAVIQALKGCDVVFHLAAIPMWVKGVNDAHYNAINVEGTRNICVACVENNIEHMVFTSSLEAVGPSRDGQPVDEETEACPYNVYGRTKLEAENIIRAYAARDNKRFLIVRLPMVYGPHNLLHLNRYFKQTRTGGYPLVGDGSALIEFCYVGNAIAGLLATLEKGRAGETYFISDERSYRFREVIEAIARHYAKKIFFVRLPKICAWCVGGVVELIGTCIKIYPFYFKETGRPAFSRRSVEWMSKSMLFCDCRKAREELHYTPVYSLDDGIAQTITWYKNNNYL